MKFTIFGGRGFIGSAIARYLRDKGYEVSLPLKSDSFNNSNIKLGHVIYCIGLTGDFRARPFETVEAHICKLANLLKSSDFDSWLYLSSTRIYSGIDNMAKESARLPVFPDLDGIYDISKLLGESLCLSLKNQKIRVARLSNVYGKGQSTNTFLGSIIDDVKKGKSLIIKESPDSKKDYISIEDVIDILVKIATDGKDRLYNVASGVAIRHSDIAKVIEEVSRIPVGFKKGAEKRVFPDIDISKIQQEFGFSPRLLSSDLKVLLK
jgi:nucleoside-diphosphate-sugar epimerase